MPGGRSLQPGTASQKSTASQKIFLVAIPTLAELEIVNELERLDDRLSQIVVENALHQHLSGISI